MFYKYDKCHLTYSNGVFLQINGKLFSFLFVLYIFIYTFILQLKEI